MYPRDVTTHRRVIHSSIAGAISLIKPRRDIQGRNFRTVDIQGEYQNGDIAARRAQCLEHLCIVDRVLAAAKIA